MSSVINSFWMFVGNYNICGLRETYALIGMPDNRHNIHQPNSNLLLCVRDNLIASPRVRPRLTFPNKRGNLSIVTLLFVVMKLDDNWLHDDF